MISVRRVNQDVAVSTWCDSGQVALGVIWIALEWQTSHTGALGYTNLTQGMFC